MILNTLPEG